MTSKTFSGRLAQAINEEAAEGNKILFIPQQTVSEVLQGAASELVVDSDGAYSIKLAYNTYSIYHYSDITKRRTLLANDIIVSVDTEATTITDLIGSFVPVNEDEYTAIEAYIAEANVVKSDAETAQETTEALYDDFDSNALASISLLTSDAPLLSVPFNDSGRLKYGIGDEYASGLPVYGVDFTRSTAYSVINKSGALESLSANEIGIGAGGAWLHGAFTNLHPSGNNLSNSTYWSGTNTVLKGSDTYAGANMFLLADASRNSNVSLRYDFSTTLATDASHYMQFLIKNSDTNVTLVTMQGSGMSSTLSVAIEWSGNDIASITGASSYRKVSDDVYLVVSEAKKTTSTAGNVSNYIFPASYVSDGSTTGSVYVGAMMVIQGDNPTELPFLLTDGATKSSVATTCSLPVNGNLPTLGESFTIKFDAEFNDYDDANYTVLSINSDVSGGSILFRKNNGNLQWYHDQSDGSDAVLFTGNTSYTIGRHRYSLTFSGGRFAMYCDGVFIASRTTTSYCWFDGDGKIYLISSYNNQLKNFEVLPYAASADEVKSWGSPK